MIDFKATMLDPIYATLGVEARLILRDGTVVSGLTVIDKVAGIDTGEGVDVATIKPAACVRVYELADRGVAAKDMPRGHIEFNDSRWQIVSTKPRPNPSGEPSGEIYVILTGRTEIEFPPESESESESESDSDAPSESSEGADSEGSEGSEGPASGHVFLEGEDGEGLEGGDGEQLEGLE